MQRWVPGLVAAIGLGTVSGCVGLPRGMDERAAVEQLSPILVMPADRQARGDEDGIGENLNQAFEAAATRNNDRLGLRPTPEPSSIEVYDIRHREHLRISSGRAREHSTTHTRTLKRGRVR